MIFETPILFLVYNRPDTTRKVWDVITKLKPTNFFIASDAPSKNNPGDTIACQKVKEICSSINWPCHLSTLYRQEHLGCKLAVSKAVSWFFDKVEYGIILEDDCLPDISFFTFCESMLITFKDQQNVMQITGNNFQHGIQRGNGSYYYSKYAHIWGWATWKRAWAHYSLILKDWDEYQHSNRFKSLFSSKTEMNYWKKKFDQYLSNTNINNYWSLQWQYTCWLKEGIIITPNKNLVKNIGFGSGTNTIIKLEHLIIESESLLPPYYNPDSISIDKRADEYTFKHRYLYKGTLLSKVKYHLVRFRKKLGV